MPFQLGPGFLRRRPRGWTTARAWVVAHRIDRGSDTTNDGWDPEMSVTVEVTWRVEGEGQEPYEFDERRRMPLWIEDGSFLGGEGKRWYRKRLRPTFGLVPSLGLPAAVNPKDPSAVWVDWDAAYEEHEPAWDREARIQRELNRRRGTLDHLVDRVTNPLAGKIRPDELEAVEAALAKERAQTAEQEAYWTARGQDQAVKMGFGPVADGERAAWEARREREAALQRTGRPAKATVVANADSGRTEMNIPVWEIALDVEDGDGGATRRVVYEHVFGPRAAKRFKVGKRVDVRIDPDDPDVLTFV